MGRAARPEDRLPSQRPTAEFRQVCAESGELERQLEGRNREVATLTTDLTSALARNKVLEAEVKKIKAYWAKHSI